VVDVWFREHRAEILCGREVNCVIEPGVRANPALKAPRPPVDLAEQLDLEPALACLHDFGWSLGSCEFGDADEADRREEINEALGNADE
jgi:hypothetical protein